MADPAHGGGETAHRSRGRGLGGRWADGDSGGRSTVAAVARSLKNHSLHVITIPLPIGEVFHDSRQIEVTLTGGYLYPGCALTMGPLCEQMLAGWPPTC